jgi:formylglycine-generating enzyme required for sulfatase activity
MRKLYTNIDKPHNPDKVYQTVTALSGDPIIPTKPQASTTAAPTCKNWPFNAATAKAMQAQAAPDGKTIEKVIELADGVKIRFVRIPAGAFIMGTPNGPADEPVAKASVDKAFWMGVCEITNAQYAAFDPKHDSRVEPWHTIQFGSRGFPMNEPTQPVIRVTQDRAVAFCRWLSTKTGKTVTLPSEVQWEWACRAGTDTPFWYGDLDSDFSKAANFSDTTMTKFVVPPYSPASGRPTPLSPYEDWIPKDARSNDGSLVTVAPGKYQANAWGLCDMHGNAAEWTRSSYDASRKVVRGGSWYTRPLRGTSSYRWGYLPRQRVYDVGFRVIIE